MHDGSGSEQRVELFDGEIGLADDRTQGATVELFMVGDNELREGIIAAQDDVATMLSLALEADLFKCTHAVTSGDARQFVHTATTSVSR